jgi:hypothetical protein
MTDFELTVNIIKVKLKDYLILDLINVTVEYFPKQLWMLYSEYGEYSDYRYKHIGIYMKLEDAIFTLLKSTINIDDYSRYTPTYESNFNDKTYDSKNNKWDFKINNYIDEHIMFFYIKNIFLNTDCEYNLGELQFTIHIKLNQNKKTNFRRKFGGIPKYIEKFLENYEPLQSFIKYVKENRKNEENKKDNKNSENEEDNCEELYEEFYKSLTNEN